ncbi:MAG: ABC transporter permease [Trueperaceae bacterium]|nr:ABC transporter permease [Trueperaceae bacterium]
MDISSPAVSAQTVTPKVKKGWWQSKAMRRFRRNPLGIIGFIILLAFVFVAIFAGPLTSSQLINYRNNCVRDLGLSRSTVTDLRNPVKPAFWRIIFAPPGSCFNMPRDGFSEIPKPPSELSILGTTSGGYDIYYGLIWGTRTAFYGGIIVTGFGLLVGIIIGSISGYFGGWIDTLFMRIIDVIFAIPGLVLSMVIVTILGQSLRNVIIALSIFAWAGYARFLRGEILRVRELDFVDGAKALGARSGRLIFRHVLPNSIGSLLILASLDIGTIVLGVAALSFLGLGAPAGYADWGQMVNFARGWMLGLPGQPFAYWYVIFWPSFIIVLFVLGWNLLGDAVRDVMDVKS